MKKIKSAAEIKRFHINETRRALRAARNTNSMATKARLLDAAAANTWLAIGAHRFVDNYNEHGVRI
jgi:hypothetical protein